MHQVSARDMDRSNKLTSESKEQNQCRFFKRCRFVGLPNATSILLYSTCLAIAFSFYLVYPRKNFSHTYKHSSNQEHNQTSTVVQPKNGSEYCDLFKGRWVPETRELLYTNYSCKTLPDSKNCLLHGRKDKEFLNWRWKPDQCKLPLFDTKEFLSILQGKTMAFIGDSVARNQMESLLCLLSMAETPIQTFKDEEDNKFATWEFPKNNFTLMVFWSQFLVTATERIINGSNTGAFNLQVDRIDIKWLGKLASIDYAIISDGQWFFRPNYLYEGHSLIGCNNCGDPNVTNMGPGGSIRRAFRTTFKEINNCEDCKQTKILLRTFSPAHFEGGEWNTGGDCIKSRPYGKEEIVSWGDLQISNIQVEEFDTARNARGGSGNVFLDVLDVTEMMIMRGDGHPGRYWKDEDEDEGVKGYRDCVHWCLPGPTETWNELLLEILKRSIL